MREPDRPGSRPRGGRATAAAASVVLTGLLCGCGGTATPGDPVGEWAGPLAAEAGRCPGPMSARLLVGARDVSFVPSGGVLVLHGHRRPDDPRLHAQLRLVDANHKPLPMVFDGMLAPDGSHIDGTYGTPGCRAHVVLTRPAEHPISRALGG